MPSLHIEVNVRICHKIAIKKLVMEVDIRIVSLLDKDLSNELHVLLIYQNTVEMSKMKMHKKWLRHHWETYFMASLKLKPLHHLNKLLPNIALQKITFPLVPHSPLPPHNSSEAATKHPWSTVGCSQPAAWTTNQSLLVASGIEAFPEDRPILARPYLELRIWKTVFGCHRYLHLTIRKCSSISRQSTNLSWLCPACLPTTTSIPAPTKTTIAMTNYTHV